MSDLVGYNGTLVEREDLSETLAVFRIRPDTIPPPGDPWFEAGQYVVLGLNTGGPKSEGVQRAYSIASEPEERRWLEFYIRKATKPETTTPFTHMLWQLEKGGRLHVGKRFVGRFTLGATVPKGDTRLRVFVAAGTGLAPFVSILRSEMRRRSEGVRGEFVVLHGARHHHELGYREDLERVLNRVQVGYFPTLSEMSSSPDWKGSTGRVETFFDGEKLDELERRIGIEQGGLNPKKALVYVCGFRGTIAETITRLIRRGFVPLDRKLRRLVGVPAEAPASLFFEQYDTDPIIDPTDEILIARLKAEFPGVE